MKLLAGLMAALALLAVLLALPVMKRRPASTPALAAVTGAKTVVASVGRVSQLAATRPSTITAPPATASFQVFLRERKSYAPDGVVVDSASRLRATDWVPTLRVPESPMPVRRPLVAPHTRRKSSASSRADA